MDSGSDKPYSIFVNSSDGFEDCWHPFFKLFNTYWPDCTAEIFLNTETKQWRYPGLAIECTRVQSNGHRSTWSECFAEGLRQVRTPLVLYMHEDFFIERPVDGALIEDLATCMHTDETIKHIGLTHFGSVGPFTSTTDPRLWKISQRSPYRISAQAGLWRVDTLLSYLRPEENAWMFELFGTRRARRREETFLTLSRELYSPANHPVMLYTHTGIIKGQWHQGMPKLFRDHDISIDFTKRGFYKRKPWLLGKLDVVKKLVGHPRLVWRGLLGQ